MNTFLSSAQGGYGTNWCSTAPCQPNCTLDEVACADDDHAGTADGNVYMWMWMYEDVYLTFDGLVKARSCVGAEVYTCHKRSKGCPVNCTQHGSWHACHSVPSCDDCVAEAWHVTQGGT